MNSHGSPPDPARLGRPRGFVLVSVLLIVALATILVVVTSMMAQIERKAAANGAKIEQARANALFALDLAVNQLQREAGPDQRVTARADILDTNSTAVSTTTVKQPLWTGVWKTFNPAATNQALDDPTGSTASANYLRNWSVGTNATTPQTKARNANVAWLVSGATNNTALNPVDWTANTTNSVLLAAGVGNTTVDVKAPLVAMTLTPPGSSTPQTVGRYAYWVADEGVKARVNLTDPTLASGVAAGSVTEQLHYLAPQANAVHKITGLMSSSTADFRTANSPQALQKLTTPESLLLLGTTPTNLNIKAYSPDITTYSSSVLADVRHGGLKKDLTAALESPDEFDRLMTYMRSATKGNDGNGNFNTDTAGRERLYRFQGPYTASAANTLTVANSGLRWLSLYNYYNLYKSSYSVYTYTNGVKQTPAITSKVAGLSSPSATSLPMRYYSYESAATTGVTNSVHEPMLPVPLAQSAYVGLTSEVVATPAGSPAPGANQHYYKLRVHVVPQLILYNPYNVTLTAPVANLQFTSVAPILNASINGSTPPKWTIQVNGLPVQTSKIMTWDGTQNEVGPPAVDNSITGSKFNVTTAPSANMTFAPGQIKVFGLAAPATATTISTVGVAANLTNDYASGIGQYAYVKANSGSDWIALCNDSDSVTVTFSSGTFRGWGKIDWLENSSRTTLRDDISFPKAWTLPGVNNGIGSNNMNTTGTVNTAPQILGTIGSLTSSSNKLSQSIAQLNIRARGTRSNDNIKLPVFSSTDEYSNPLTYDRDGFAQELVLITTASLLPSSLENTVDGNLESRWGKYSAGTETTDQSRLILKEIPNKPLVSLGQFQHVMGDLLYPLGGSLANETVPTSATGLHWDFQDNKVFSDHNFLANEALFDRFFLSTVPNAYQDSNPANYYPFEAFNNAYIAANKSLPNARLSYYSRNGTKPTLAELRTYDQAAAKLMLTGGFNINSTSVDAWTAFLSSVSGRALTTGVNKTDSPYLRHSQLTAGVSSTAAWGGIANLSDTQITELATKIVAEVKSRGPFLSLGDFLNRRLGPNDDKSRRGALQAAIDNSTINAALQTGATSVGVPAGHTKSPAASNDSVPDTNMYQESGWLNPTNLQEASGTYPNTAKGIPGWLMQNDLVQALAPAMTARSDTFLVRVYGEAVNPKTQVAEAKAYGEAVIQRLPDFVDSADSAEVWDDNTNYNAADTTTFKSALTSSVNKTFGRRFKIVFFRWLPPNDL